MPLARDPRVDQILTGRTPIRRSKVWIPPVPSSAPSVGSLIGARPARFGEEEALSSLKNSTDNFLHDTPVSLAKGLVGIGEAAVGLANIPTALAGAGPIAGNMVKEAGYDPKLWQDALSEQYSPDYKAALAEVEKAKGFVPSVKAYLENPSAIAQSLAQNTPALVATGGIARGVLGAAPKVLAPLARVMPWGMAPELPALAAGAIGEGTIQAGQSAEQTRQNTGGLTPKQALLSMGSGALDAAIVGLSGQAAKRLGIEDIDVMLAGGASQAKPKNLLRRVGEGFLTEGVLQELPQSAQEQALQNISEGRPWSEGVPESSAAGMITGGVMGVGANLRGASDLNATAVPSQAGEPGENPEISGDPVLDALVGRRPEPPAAPPARFGEEEALSKLGARPPAPEAPPEFAQSDLQRTVDSRARVAPIRDMVSRVRDETARRAQIIREGTPEELDAYLRDSVRAVQEANLRTDPATDPTVISIVLSTASEGGDPTRVLRAAGIQNAAAVVRQINETNPLAIFKEAQAQDLAQSQGSVKQRQAEEAWAADPKTQAAMEAARYQSILAKAVAMNSMKPLVEEAGLNPGQADKALKKAKRAMVSEHVSREIVPLPGVTEQAQPVDEAVQSDAGRQESPEALPARGSDETRNAPVVVESPVGEVVGPVVRHGESVPPSDAEVSAHFSRVAARVREIKRSEPNLPHRVIAQRVNQEFGNDNRLGRGHEALTRRMVDEVLKGEENPKTSDKGNYPGGPVAAMVNSRKDTGLQNDPERALYEAMDRMDRQQGHIAESVAAREEKAAENVAEGERLGERLEESVRNPRGKRVEREPAVVGADQGARGEGIRALLGTQNRPRDDGNAAAGPAVDQAREGALDQVVADEAPRPEAHAESVPPKAVAEKRVNPPQVAQPIKAGGKVTVRIPIRNGFVEETGDSYILPGFEEFKTVVVRPSGNKSKATKQGWRVYEQSTGMQLSEAMDIPGRPSTEGEAITLAVQRLQALGKPGFNQKLAEFSAAASKAVPEEIKTSPTAEVETTTAKPQAPAVAAEKVTDQIERVVDTKGVKSAKDVHELVMAALQEELEAAKKVSPFKTIEYRTDGMRGNTPNAWIGVDGRGYATLAFEGLHTINPRTKIEIDIPKNMTHAKVEPMVKLAVARHLTPKAGNIRVQIPGDGTFTIARNIVAIQMTLDRIKSGGASVWKSVVGYKPGPAREAPKTHSSLVTAIYRAAQNVYDDTAKKMLPVDRDALDRAVKAAAVEGVKVDYRGTTGRDSAEQWTIRGDDGKGYLLSVDPKGLSTWHALGQKPAESAPAAPPSMAEHLATIDAESEETRKRREAAKPAPAEPVASKYSDFTADMAPMARGKAVAALEKAINTVERGIDKRGPLVEKMVADGFKVTTHQVDDPTTRKKLEAEWKQIQGRYPIGNPSHPETIRANEVRDRLKGNIRKTQRRLGSDNYFWTEDDLGKTAMDYAEFLIAKRDGGAKAAPEAKPERADMIEKIVATAAAGHPKLTIRERFELKATDGKWYRGSLPWGVGLVDPVERRSIGWGTDNESGVGVGKIMPTREALEQSLKESAERRDSEFRTALEGMSDERLKSQAEYWLKTEAPKAEEKTPAKLISEARERMKPKGTKEKAAETLAPPTGESTEDRLRREVAEANAKMHGARTAMEKAGVTVRRVEGNVRDMNPDKGRNERRRLKEAEDAYGDATEAYRAKRRELIEQTGDEAQKLIARAGTYDAVDKAKMREIVTAAVNAHEDAKGLSKKEREAVIEKLSNGELSYAWWSQIGDMGLEKAIKVNVKALSVDRAVADAVKKVKAMDGLAYRTGYKQSSEVGILRDLKNASTVEQVAAILKEAEAANEVGLEKKRQEERKQAEEREADRLKTESLKAPMSPAVVKEIQTLSKGEYEALTSTMARTLDYTTGSESTHDKLAERGYVDADRWTFTPAGKEFATQVQRYEDRLKFGVPIAERAPTKGTFMNATEKDTKMIASKFEGQEFHSEGHWLVKGKLPEKRGSQPVKMNESFGNDPQNLFSKVLNPSKGFGEEVHPVAFYRREDGSAYAKAGDDLLVMSNGGIFNGKYVDYILALHPGAKMSAINAESQLNFRKDGKIVGVVMGIKGPPPAGAMALVPETDAPSFSRRPSSDQDERGPNRPAHTSEIVDLTMFKTKNARDLILQHNLTAANLIHADKMGGLAVPSMAVGKVDMPLEGFGEITLLGDKSLADPRESGMQVFSGDIYSPRYPTIRYKIRRASVIDEALKESNKAIGYSDWQDEAKKGGIDALSSSNPNVVWTFLRSKGIEPDVRLSGPSPERMAELRRVPGLEAFFGKPTYQNQENPEFRRLALEELKTRHESLDEEESRLLRFQQLTEDQKRNVTRHLAYELEDAGTNKVDRGRSRDSLRDQLHDLGLEREFETFRRDLFERAGSESKIFKGFTNAGNERTIPHTLENVVAEMKRNMKAGEGFSYGPGTVRGAVAPRLKSLREIRNAKDRIVSKEAMEDVKEEVNTAFWEAAGHLPTGEGFGSGDRAVDFMVDVSRMGFPRAEREYGWKLSDADRKAVGDFMTMLQTVPTEYFEAKLPRAVGIGEFSAAVVPSDADPKAIGILERHGIKIERYDKSDPADRKRAISEATEGEGMRFNRPGAETTEDAWENYNGKHDAERAASAREAYRDGVQVVGAPAGVRIVDFEGDVDKSVLKDMAGSSAALAARVVPAVRMLQAHVPALKFGGFTPAGNLHGVNVDGRLFVNQLATHQIAVTVAQEKGITYHEAFAKAMTDVLLHEAAHYAEKGHGDAFQAELDRIKAALGPIALKAIRRDFMRYASDNRNKAQNARMYDKALPGWREGERRGREAAERGAGRGTVRTGSDVAERLHPRPRGDTNDSAGAGVEGAEPQGRLPLFDEHQAEGLAAPAFVRGTDGSGVEPASFSRKPPTPHGQLLEEETNAQRLQQKLQNRLNRLDLGEAAVNARKGITAAPSLANRIFGISPRVENAVSVAEHSILNPILEGVKKNGLDWDLLGDYAKGDKEAAVKVADSKKKALYDAARDQIKGVFDRSDAVRLATGIDDEETIAAAKKKRGPAGVKITKEHPLYEAVRELESSIFRAEHNRAMENLADFVEKNGVPEFGMVRQGEPSDGPNDGQNSILLKRNGETWSIDLADDKMAAAIKKLNTDQIDVMTRTIGSVTRWVSRINTLWSPTFTLKNKIRDVGNAVLSSMILNGAPNGISRSVAFKVAAGQVPAWKGTREYMRNPAGKFPQGSPAWWAQQAHKNAAVPGYFKSIESIDRIESRLGSALKASQRQNALRDFGAFLMGLAQAGEASTRVSVYRALVEEGMSPSKAGDVARGTLDVNKRGEWAKAIGAFSPFFNSSVQGTARLVEMVRSPDPAVRQRAQATMASLVTGGLLVGAALAAWGGDDDQDRVPDSDQVPEWDTQRNLVIPWLGGTRLRIPLPQGFSAPFYAGFMLGKTGRGNATAKQAAGNIGTAFYDQFAPISSPFGVAQPLADVARNQKFSGGPIRPIRYPGMLQPSSQMAFKSTSAAAKGVAAGLNRLTGGDDAVPGLVDLSPGDIEYLAKAGTGGLGKFLSDAYTASESLVRGETPKRVPLISDFVVDANAGQRARFYEQSRDVDQAESRLKLVEGAVRRGVLQAAVPGMDFSRTPLSDLREATAGVSFSPEQRARFRSQDRALMALKPMFDAASKSLKVIDAMPNGPEKDAAFERISLKVNRAYQAAIRGGAQ